MDFARTILGIPVPRVHAWSSEPTEVGADFIVCEKAPGMDLSQVWAQTGYEASHQVFHVSRQINIMEQKFLDNPLSSYGSVFYKKDIGGLHHEPLWPDGRQDKASEKFVIGPMMSQDFWRGERAKMEVDRGPCKRFGIGFTQTMVLIRTSGKHPATYVSALIKSEQEWLRRYARPRPTGDQFIRSDEDNSPGAHIELLDKLLSVIHALILGAEGSPTLGHPGLEKPNIFVSPTPPHDILGVVGWKTTTVRPMYLQVKFPKAMQYAGGLFQLNDKTEIPRLPDNFERLSLGEQANLMSHQWQAAVHVHHMSLIKKDVRHLMPLTHPYAPLFIHSIFRATRTWEDGMYGLKQALALIQFGWDVLADPGIPCPLAFSPEEIKSVEESTKRWEAYDHWVKSLSKELGVGCDGIVDDAEEFELVKRKSDEFQRRWDVATMGGPYPFQDGGRSVMV